MKSKTDLLADIDRLTAERDAGLAREAALAQNLKYAEEGYLSIAESADASAQTLHEVITRLRSERDAALGQLKDKREEFSKLGDRYDALQALLTAADERADVLEGLLRRAKTYGGLTPAWHDAVDGAIKPAQGGGDDHVKHYECIGKGGDYTVVAIAQGAGTLKGFNHYVYKNSDGVHFVRDPEDFLSRMQIKP